MLRLTVERGNRLPWHELVNEGMLGLLLAFGLLLFYLTGDLLFTGEWEFEAESYQRLGITMSVIGLSAALLMEKAADRLRDLMERFLSQEKTV